MVWPFSSSTSPTGDSESSITEEKGRKLQAVEDVAKARETRQQRKRKLIEAVNENCALEGAALLECQDSWSLWNRMTLCQSFQSRYMECMNTQRSLLLQLGFAKEGNTAEEDELIKWHADELYQKQKRDTEKSEKEKSLAEKKE